MGAKAFGMRTAFVNRRRRPLGNSKYPPDLAVRDFCELSEALTRGKTARPRAGAS